MKKTILNLWQENGTLSMVNQMRIMMLEMKLELKSNLCNYNDAYILVRGDITDTEHQVTQATFKNCVSFTKYITKIDGAKIDDVQDLTLIIPMYNLIEYISNYLKLEEVHGFIQMMEQRVLMLISLIIIILNLSDIRLNY